MQSTSTEDRLRSPPTQELTSWKTGCLPMGRVDTDPFSTDTSSTTEPTSQNRSSYAMNVQKLLRISLFSVLALLLVGGLATAQAQLTPEPGDDEVYVFDSNGDVVTNTSGNAIDFGDIQSGIDELRNNNSGGDGLDGDNRTDAGENGTVLVGDGTFNETVTVNSLGATIKSDGADDGIDPANTTIQGRVLFNVPDGNETTTLEGFTILSPSGATQTSLVKNSDATTSEIVIEDNVIDVNEERGDGFGFAVESPLRAEPLTIKGNTIKDGLTGILISGGSGASTFDIENNVITGMSDLSSSFPEGAGVKVNAAVDGASTTNIKGNQIGTSSSGNDRGILVEDSGENNTVNIEKNNIVNSSTGLEVEQGAVSGGMTVSAIDNYWGDSAGPVDEVTSPTQSDVAGSSNRGAGTNVRVFEDNSGATKVATGSGSGDDFSFVPFVTSSISNAGADGDLSSITIENSERGLYDNDLFVNTDESTGGTVGDATDPFKTINNAVSAALPGETIVVEGRQSSTYGAASISGLGTGDDRVESLSGLAATVTLAANTDLSSNVDIAGNLDFAQSYVEGGNSVTVDVASRDGSAFFSVTDGNTLELSDGRTNIASSGVLETGGALSVEDGNVLSSGARVAFSRDDVNVTYDPSVGYSANSPSSNLDTGNELPANPNIGILLIGDDGGIPAGNRVTFTASSVTADSLNLDANDDGISASFTGNLEVSDNAVTADQGKDNNKNGVLIPHGSDLSVAGTLTLSGSIQMTNVSTSESDTTAALKVEGSLNGKADVNNDGTDEGPGNVVISRLGTTGSTDDAGGTIDEPLIIGDGAKTDGSDDGPEGLIAMNDLTIQLNDSLATNSSTEDFTVDLAHIKSGNNTSGNADLEITGSVDTDTRGSSDDSIVVGFDDDGESGTVLSVGGGDDFTTLPDLAGTLRFTAGNPTVTTEDANSNNTPETDLGSNSGVVEVQPGAELTLQNQDADGDLLSIGLGDDNTNGSVDGGITGEGTLRFAGSSGFEISDEGSESNDIAQTIEPSIIADQSVAFDGNGIGTSDAVESSSNEPFEVGPITANAQVSFSSTGTTDDISGGDDTSLSGNTVNGSVTIPSGGELQTGSELMVLESGALDVNGGNAVVGNGLNAGLSVSAEGDGTFAVSGGTLTVGTDLTIGSSPSVNLSGAGIAFTLDGTTSTIDLAKSVTVGSLDINKLAAQTVVTGSPLVVDGNVNVDNPGGSPSVALKLESDLQIDGGNSFDLNTQTQAGDTFNATGGDGAIVFTNGGTLTSTGGNDATVGNVTVGLDSQTGGNVTVDSDFDFTGTVGLANGDLSLSGTSSDPTDLSPDSDSASVAVRTGVSGGSISTGSNSTFNGDGVKYDLAYDGGGSSDVLGEAVADTTLANFEVLGSGTTATLDKTIQPSDTVTVESGATLGGSGTLNVTEADEINLAGTINATIESGGTRTVDGGDDGTFNGDVTASGPDASVTITADEVTGTITVSDEATVTFDGSAQVGGNLSASGESAVNLQGDVTATDVTLTDNPDSTGTTSIALGDNDLVVQGDFSGGKRVSYSAGNGSVVFDTDGTVSSSNEVIPNIAVRDGNDDESIGSPEIADKDTLAFDGTLDLQGGFQTNAGDGTVRAAGSTVSVGTGTIGVPQFVIDSGSSTTIVEDGSGSDDTGTLAVADTLNFESGELDHAVDVQVQNVLDFRPSGDVSITATAGRLELNDASVLMGADLPVPAIATVGGSGSNLASDDGQRDLLVGRSLDLENQLTTTSETEVVVTDGNDVTVTRLNDYSGNDVLDDSLSFESGSTTYDLAFGGDAGSDVSTGFEVSSDDSRIDSLTVDFGNAGTELSLASNSSIQEGTVTVNGALQALSGNVDYGTDGSLRDLAVASGAEILREPDGDFIAGSSSDPIQIEGNNYTVAYRSSGGGSVTPDAREFPEGRNLALRVQAGVRNSDGSADAGDFELTFARSVDSLDVTAIGTNSDAVLTSALDVGGSADVSGAGTLATDGDETDSDIDPAQDSLSVGGAATISGSATLNGADIAGSLTSEGGTANNVDVAGDVTIEAGGSLGSAVRLDGEGVQGLTLGDNVDQADVSSLTVDQSATADTETPRVELSGGDLNMESGGNGLTLNGGLIVAQNDELVDLNDAGFDRNVEDGETSHVVGSVRQTVAPGGTGDQVRANFPVGTEAGSFRSYELIFPNGLAETELTVDHVTTDPGTEGLPVEDETGVTVQSTPGYRWEVTSDQNVGLGQSYEVSLQADSLDFSEVPADNFRLVRRGNVEGSAFSLIGTGENYSNFRTQQDGEAQIRTSSATEDITTAGVIFTVGQPTAETAEGLQIAGQVNYPTVSDGNVVDGRALEGVEVEATSGDVTETATTDADGNFTIGGLDSGDYEVTANVDRDVSNVSIGDAQRTVSGFAGTEPFAGAFQEEVADVNASGTANATDALRIAFFDLGSISSFEAGSFLVDTTEVTLGSESESGVSIRVAEFGDADLSGGSSDSGGSTSLATTTVSPKSSAQTAAKSATESASDANRVAAGETFEVPVRVDRGAEVGSYSLSLEYDTEKATFEGISSGRDDIITNGSKEDGTLQVGWFDRSGESTLELTGGSELVTLRFSAAEGVEGAEFAPEITSGEINGPGAKAVAAGVETQAVRIAKPAPDEFALNGSYPNPASQQATVEIDLPVRAQVTVEVYNTLGQRVQTVEQSMSAGAGQTVQLDASQLASGQYFYRVKASLDGNQTRETGRLTIVK